MLKNRETVDILKMQPLEYHANLLASFSDVSAVYDGHQISEPVKFEVQRGERIFIDRKNGSGKSSLLKMLLNYPIEHTGTIIMV